MITTPCSQEPLASFVSNTEAFRKRLKDSEEAITLTADGQPELVVLSVVAFQKLVDQAKEQYHSKNGNREDEEWREWTWEELTEEERQGILADARDPEQLEFL